MLLIKKNFTIKFRAPNGINKVLKIEHNKKCSEMLEKFYKENPEFKKEKYDFIFGAKKLDLNKTIEENEIKDNDIIFINKGIYLKIKVVIRDTSQNINEEIECIESDKASILRKKIKIKRKELNNDNFVLLFNGDKLDENKTIEENEIKNNSVLLIIKTNVTIQLQTPDNKLHNLNIEFNKNVSELLKEIYKQNPMFRDEKYDLTSGSIKLNSNKTIIDNGINDHTLILIKKQKIKLRIQDTSQNINEIIECEEYDKASLLREKIIAKHQELKNIEFYFLVNGNKLNEEKTIKESRIKNNNFILLIGNNEPMPNNNSDMIVVVIKSSELKFEYPFACKRSSRFSTLLEKFYKKEPNCRYQNNEFTIGNRVIDIDLTLEQNNINDCDTIDYKKKEEEEEGEEDPNEISVIFKNSNFAIPLICNKKDLFKDLKDQFLERRPEYKNKNVFFIAHANFLDTKKSIEENNIKDSSIIMVNDY